MFAFGRRLVPVLLTTMALVVTATPSSAAPTRAEPTVKPTGPAVDAYFGVDATVADLMRAQATTTAAAALLQQHVHRRSGHTGFTNLEVDDAAVVLRWKGALPTDVAAAVSRARSVAPVRVVQARHSLAELHAAAEGLAKEAETGGPGGVHTVTLKGDGSGILLGVTPDGRGAIGASKSSLGVPVQTYRAEPMVLLTRNNDSAPWWGGAAIANTNGRGNCSSAFAVSDSGTGQWLLTAAHCGTPPDYMNDGAGDRIGQVTRENWQHDVLLVSAAVRGTGQGRVLTGGPDANTNLPVGGWDHARPGELYCQSGVTTARTIGSQLCGLRVEPDFTKRACGYDSDNDWTCVSDLASARHVNGQTAVRPGDSGGPVYGISSSNRAIARGLVSATPDGGVTLYFQDYATVYADMGVRPIVG